MESIINLTGLMGLASLCAFSLAAGAPLATSGSGRKPAPVYATARVATFDAPKPHPLAPTSWSRRG